MTFYDRLVTETAGARAEFISIPLIERVLHGAASAALYLDFLAQAFHHVRHTCPLLTLAAMRTDDSRYREALLAYIEEETGHEQWILDDIAALGGDVDAVVREGPRLPCRLMVGYAYYATDWLSPYSLLGMVHVLEGMSVAFAGKVAARLQARLGLKSGQGLRYLQTHGALDVAHTAHFRTFVNGLCDPEATDAIVTSAVIMYRLYGDIFRDLGARHPEGSLAA